MKQDVREFGIRLLEWKEIHERPESWPLARLRVLLEQLELAEVTDSEAREMAVMALQDRDVDDASDIVLQAVFGDVMRVGIRQNLVPELREDRPWEEFADLSQQAGIFDSCVILQESFPREFGRPDAVAVRIHIASESATARGWLAASPPPSALLLRLLATGMDERAVLRRVFEASLEGDRCPEASSILWTADGSAGPDGSHEFTLISSHQWLDPLEDVESFRAEARPDSTDAGEDA